VEKPRPPFDDDTNRGLIEKLSWEMDTPLWLPILTLPGGKVQAGKTPVDLAGRLIAHFIGTDFAPEKGQALQDEYTEALGGKVKALPTPVA
jgi:hypothetical protein